MLNKMTLSLIALISLSKITYVCTLESHFGPVWIIVQIWCSGRLYSVLNYSCQLTYYYFHLFLCFATQL